MRTGWVGWGLSALLLIGCAKTEKPGAMPDLAVSEGPREDAGVDLADAATARQDLLDVDALSFSERCFGYVAPGIKGPNYDQFHPKYETAHCSGTNAQDITGVQQVVFLGDSITVGTPPTSITGFYRSQLATMLAQKFSLAAPNQLWMADNPLTKTSGILASGDFKSCAKWGAHIHDVYGPDGDNQAGACFADVEPKKTLVIITAGGNDLAQLQQEGSMGATKAALEAEVDQSIAALNAALAYFADPAHFPNGAYVILTNNYEYTDGTGILTSCATAALSGITGAWPDSAEVYIYFEEQLVKTAVNANVDILFLGENFCGHGFQRNDTSAPCYRGPNTPLWFDPNTCTHPNADGHTALAHLFEDVVNE